MGRRTRHEHVQQARARTNIPVMMTLMVLTTWAVLAENPDGERRRRSYNVHELCRSGVEDWKPMLKTMGPYKTNVISYCIDIVYHYFIMPGDEKAGCMKLHDVIKNRHSYSSYFGYLGTARLVYFVLCPPSTTATTATPPIVQNITAIPTIATDKPEPQEEECGRSESLKEIALEMLNDYQERITGQRVLKKRIIGERVFQKRIIGGNEVDDCSIVPWQVHLEIGDFLCGGSLISRRHILTASHCLEKAKRLEDVKVILADEHLNDDDERSSRLVTPIRNMTQHHDFHPVNFVSDIAIVTLKYPIMLNDPCLGIICRNPHFNFDGRFCLVSGWGRQKEEGSLSSTLKIVMLQASHGGKCNKKFGIEDADYVYDKEQMICAGHVTGGKDSCKGDSGGPLVCLDTDTDRFVQVGVVSYGTGCGDAGFPGVYSNVAYFNDWINKIMAENDY